MQRYFCVLNASCKVKPRWVFKKISSPLSVVLRVVFFLKNLAEAKHRPFYGHFETKSQLIPTFKRIKKNVKYEKKCRFFTDCFLKRIPLFLPLSNKKFQKDNLKAENRAYRVQTSRKAVKLYKTPKMQQDEKKNPVSQPNSCLTK